MNTCVRRISILLLIFLAMSVQLLPEMLWAAKAQLNRATSAPVVNVPPPTPQPKPDLAITSMSWSNPLKEGYGVGQNSILNYSIKNLGNAPSGNFKIKFTCPSCPPSMAGERNVISLAPGAAYNANWPSGSATPEKWTGGSYTLQAMVDPDHVVDDSNQTNNQKVLPFTVQKSLILMKKAELGKMLNLPKGPTGITITSVGGIPDNIYAGDTYSPSSIFVMVKNTGSAPSGDFGVSVTCAPVYDYNNAPDNCLAGFENLHKDVQSLNPGQTFKATFPAGASGMWNWGTYRVKAAVDWTNTSQIKEFIVNNRAVIDSIGGIPNPFYEGDSFDPASTFVIFRNATTSAKSAPFWARVTCEPVSGSGWNSTTPQCPSGFNTLHDLVPEIYPGQTYKLTFPATGAKPWPFGKYKVWAKVIATSISTSKDVYVKSHNQVPPMTTATVDWQGAQTNYQGPCPGYNAIMINAKISVNGQGTLKWKMISNKGDSGAAKTQTFDGPGLAYDGVIAGATKTENGWYAIKVLEPFAWQSPKINYSTTCVAP